VASGNLWLNHLTSCLGKVGCAPFVGGNFDSMAFSPTTVVLSNQIIGEARKFAQGFSLDDEAVNLKEIDRVGPGGDYFTSEQTLASMHEISDTDALWSSISLDVWKKQGKPSVEEELIETTKDLYTRSVKLSEEAMDLVKKGEDFIEKQKS